MNEGPYQNSIINQTPFTQTDMPNMMPYQMMPYRMMYPEVYYKLNPYIMNVVDQMDAYGYMPTQEMMDRISDGIYEDMTRMYPDMVEYARSQETMASSDPAVMDVINGDFDRFRHGFRRRGLLRDLIDILLLSEFHRRRRRRDY